MEAHQMSVLKPLVTRYIGTFNQYNKARSTNYQVNSTYLGLQESGIGLLNIKAQISKPKVHWSRDVIQKKKNWNGSKFFYKSTFENPLKIPLLI